MQHECRNVEGCREVYVTHTMFNPFVREIRQFPKK